MGYGVMGRRLVPMGLERTRFGGSCGAQTINSNGAISLARLSVCIMCFPGNFAWGNGLLAGDQDQVHVRWEGSPSAAKAISAKWASLQGFPNGASGKEHDCQCRRRKRCGPDPWVGKIPWRRAQQPTQIFLPGESHEQRSLASYSP